MSAAVEAAARAWFDRQQAQRLDPGRKRDDGQRWQWEDLTEDDRVGYRALIRPIAEAARRAALQEVVEDSRPLLELMNAEDDRLFAVGSSHGLGAQDAHDMFREWIVARSTEKACS